MTIEIHDVAYCSDGKSNLLTRWREISAELILLPQSGGGAQPPSDMLDGEVHPKNGPQPRKGLRLQVSAEDVSALIRILKLFTRPAFQPLLKESAGRFENV